MRIYIVSTKLGEVNPDELEVFRCLADAQSYVAGAAFDNEIELDWMTEEALNGDKVYVSHPYRIREATV